MREEVGDLLFTLANLARKLEVDPEAALAGTNRKFRQRFAKIEEGLAAQGKTAAEATLEEMDALWEAAKGEELIEDQDPGLLGRLLDLVEAGRDVERHGVPGDLQRAPGNPVSEQDERVRPSFWRETQISPSISASRAWSARAQAAVRYVLLRRASISSAGSPPGGVRP